MYISAKFLFHDFTGLFLWICATESIPQSQQPRYVPAGCEYITHVPTRNTLRSQQSNYTSFSSRSPKWSRNIIMKRLWHESKLRPNTRHHRLGKRTSKTLPDNEIITATAKSKVTQSEFFWKTKFVKGGLICRRYLLIRNNFRMGTKLTRWPSFKSLEWE